MNKEKFLAALRRRLRALPADEVERILAYYREMIDDKVESGWTEEDAVKEYGSISALAQKILAEKPKAQKRWQDCGSYTCFRHCCGLYCLWITCI